MSARRETSLETYHEALAPIVAVELAQIHILEEFFDIRLKAARMVYGYSLGESTAVCAAGVFKMEHGRSTCRCRWRPIASRWPKA